MVLKRRMSYGSRGYYLPPIPDVPKSTKRKRTARRKFVQDPLAAFDMLATVAGKLLMNFDTDSEPVNLDGAPKCNSTLKKEPLDEPLDELREPKMESLDQNSTNQSSRGASSLNPKTLIKKIPDLHTNGYEVQLATNEGEADIGLVRSNSSESSSEFSLYSGGVKVAPDPNPSSNETRVAVNTDDDENSSWCMDRGVAENKTSKRMKKSCADKYRRVISRIKKHETKNSKDSKRNCFAHKMPQRNGFKRRKLFHHSSVSSSDSQVRLSIKSFKVPELSIEIPESASVGMLKRTVMEALAAVLEGELSVGVMLQGNKIKDSSSTLREAGIYLDSPLLDTVEFTLEPDRVHASPSVQHISDNIHDKDILESLTSIVPAANPTDDHSATPGSSLEQVPVPVPTTPVKSHVTDIDPVLSPIEVSSADQTAPEISQAIVPLPVPSVKVEPLAIVPAVRKTRQTEILGQRRMRRPFSVAEVEALVAAVEKLGTGRWRDVKIRAFDNAQHRTYVDLKDKWKTLVHTANIAPQQRRGEPVPQELLDRVLEAQAYWSNQHSKLSKSSFGEPGLSEFDSSPLKITSL